MRRQRRTTFPAESATILGHPPQAATPGFPKLAPKPSFVQSRYPLYMIGNQIQAQPPSRVQGQAQGSAQKSTQTQTQSSSSKYYAPSQTRPYTSPYPTLRTLAPKPLPRLAPKPVPNPTPTPALGSAPRLTFPPPPIHSAFGLLLGRGYGAAHSGSPAPAPAAVPRPFLRPGFGDPEPDVSNPAPKMSWDEYEI
ncbi:hypothetical protein BKA64DRAFT_686669 [Cadophora sp. MPI-SDFR-AT-0126]|nr:hypothetical protein BKA64DRAFT_686669 [Leotiomycetes sp. MPI-SDFR-AT-0126]